MINDVGVIVLLFAMKVVPTLLFTDPKEVKSVLPEVVMMYWVPGSNKPVTI
jgi:hypothetical protein